MDQLTAARHSDTISGFRNNQSYAARKGNIGQISPVCNHIIHFGPYVEALVDRLSEHQATVGIVLLGGLGRRSYIDDHSDLDLAVFVDTDEVDFLPPFSFHLSLGGKRIEFNLTQQNILREDYLWDEPKRSAYRNGLIVYEKDAAISQLLRKTLRVEAGDYRDAVVTSLNQMYWKGMFHARSAATRGYPETAHFLINEAVNLAVKCVFALNFADRPHEKWQLSELEALTIMPTQFLSKITTALLVREVSTDDAARRSELIRDLVSDLSTLARDVFPEFPEDVYRYWASNLSGRQINCENPVDRLTEVIAPRCSQEELELIRGSLAWVMTRGPKTVGDLIDYARTEPILDGQAIKYIERTLERMRDLPLSILGSGSGGSATNDR